MNEYDIKEEDNLFFIAVKRYNTLVWKPLIDIKYFKTYKQKCGKNRYRLYTGYEYKKGYIITATNMNRVFPEHKKIPKNCTRIHNNYELIKKYYTNPELIPLKRTNNEYKEIKKKFKNFTVYKIYNILDDHKYMVYIKDNEIYIYSHSNKHYIIDSNVENHSEELFIKLEKHYICKKIFLPTIQNENELFFPNIHDNEVYGILIQLKNDSYIHIGNEIISFESNNEEIKYYYTSCGESIGIGNSNLYLLSKQEFISHKDIECKIEINEDKDIITYYKFCSNKISEFEKKNIPIPAQKLKNLKEL